MQVEVEIDGTVHIGEPDGTRVKVETGRCVCCSDLDAAVNGEGRVVALAATPQGMQKALRDFPGCRPQPAHEAGPLYVNSPDSIEGEREIRGRAICCRCRRPTGQITVRLNSMFGLQEDRAVRERARAY